MTVDIYDAEINDISEIQDLIQAVLASRHEAPQLKRMMSRLYSADSLKKSLESDNRYLIVAIIEDVIAGVCQYGIPIMDDCDCEDLRMIQFLYVHPEFDHDEIASALIYDVEESINEQAGVQRLSVFVPSDSRALIKFYASLDFYHDQVEDQENDWYMEKDL